MRWTTWVGIGLIVTAIVLGYLGLFTGAFDGRNFIYRFTPPTPFVIFAGVLFLAGIVLLGVSPPPMGTMKVTGFTLIIVGLVGFFASLASLSSSELSLSEYFGFGAYSGTYWPLLGILILGLLWGPVLMVIGLGLLLVSDRRERAAVPA